jgi:hypothetical protein
VAWSQHANTQRDYRLSDRLSVAWPWFARTHDAGVDERIEFSSWAEMKPGTPLGALPTLTLPSGVVVAQSEAIMRYAAAKAGVALSPEDGLLADELAATAMEMLNKCPQVRRFSPVPARSDAMIRTTAAGDSILSCIAAPRR